MSKRIYVLRSADETYTKIGISQSPDWRVDVISKETGKDYYIVYASKFLESEEALKIESKIKEKYKDKTVFKTEHFNIHPLTLIRDIISIIGIPKKKDDIQVLTCCSKYTSWVEQGNTKYNKLTNYHKEDIKIANDYSAYVRLLYNGRMVTVGFANIKDAERFATKYKHSIRALNKITKLLYNKNHNDWVEETFKSIENPYTKWFFI